MPMSKRSESTQQMQDASAVILSDPPTAAELALALLVVEQYGHPYRMSLSDIRDLAHETGSVSTKAADVLAIPITAKVCEMAIGADAEALTIADGVDGQEIFIVLVTAGGGVGSITANLGAQLSNLDFVNAGDSAHLVFANDVWHLVGADAIVGHTVSTKAGDVLPIPITSRICEMTTAGDAEALTIADGTEGQRITLVLITDGGGDGTIAQTGSNLAPSIATSIVFADAGDAAELLFTNGYWAFIGGNASYS